MLYSWLSFLNSCYLWWHVPGESRVSILDSTLREGEQTPGVVFSEEWRVRIAKALSDIGVGMIEVGDPSVAPDIKSAIKKIVKLKKDGEIRSHIVVHSRAVKQDLENAASLEPDRVAVFYGVSDLHLKHKHRKTREEALSIIAEMVSFAKSHGVAVRFTAEDASRADLGYLIEVVKTAYEAGADRVSIADTVGVFTPDRAREVFAKVKAAVPGVGLDIHAHNDFGMAVANSLAAVEGGADVVHTTVNGLGERAGITPLQVFAAAYYYHKGVKLVELEKLPEITAMVEAASGITLMPTYPIVGENAFTHKAGVHQAGVLANPETYEPIPPEVVGRTRDFSLDKYSGRKAIQHRLEKLGVSLQPEALDKVVEEVKRMNAPRLRDEDLLEIVEKVSGVRYRAIVNRHIEAYIWLKVANNVYTTSVARRVAALKNVVSVSEITGEYDIVVKLVAENTEELNQAIESIRQIKGVASTFTSIVLKELPTISMQTRA
ncbi:MAG: homocitrate synthase [Pyrobaculum arsenaticum]|uniref:Homocitrate synthase n=4 Tax=Pyrobaculum TaxID=2276 RepID=A4WMI8_PYRAR|nr:homocitrate synthase [Pyrobaculum arsenaticum]ABP51605.1 homocitrate synthase [Pyrobaculum arsenaticum DSM 13514]MCY0891761.1 homocitrate synthase [Pyrobaculum arsenaticum]NYR16427.1 homocitrate synthase [Pyrobaculum arsenaticum]